MRPRQKNKIIGMRKMIRYDKISLEFRRVKTRLSNCWYYYVIYTLPTTTNQKGVYQWSQPFCFIFFYLVFWYFGQHYQALTFWWLVLIKKSVEPTFWFFTNVLLNIALLKIYGCFWSFTSPTSTKPTIQIT